MATKEAIAQVLRQVALGDEDATEELALYLEQSQVHGPTAAQQQEEEYQAKKAYLAKVLQWSRENPDIAFSDEEYAHAVEVDAHLMKAAPHMTEEARLNLAAEVTREQLGDPESRDYQSAIAQMAAARTKQPVEPPQAKGRIRDEESERFAEGIEQLRQGRMPHNNEAAEEAERRAALEPRRPRMQRAVPWPER
jgi:hypothetical protein